MKENKTNREWVLEYLADHPQATGQEIYTGISAKGCKAPLSSITALISQLAGKGGGFANSRGAVKICTDTLSQRKDRKLKPGLRRRKL